MTTLCDSSHLGHNFRNSQRLAASGDQARGMTATTRICWNCSGTMRLRESCCPRCGAERLREGNVTTWRLPQAVERRKVDLIKVAGLLAAFLAGVVWLSLRAGF